MMRPEDIKNRTFGNALRGYDKDEVRSFLFKVAESSQELHDQLTATEQRLAAASEAAAQADEIAEAETAETEVAHGVADDFAEHDGGSALEVPAVEATLATTPAAYDPHVADEHDLASAEQSIADRYGALGDRIAELLRNADESAASIIASAESESVEMRNAAAEEAAQLRADAEAQAAEMLAEAKAIRDETDAYREQVMAELEVARSEQQEALAEAKAAAESEVETFRVDSINEIENLRADALAEVEELRSGATNEVELLRTTAQQEADALRQSAISDGQAAIAENEAEAARLRQEAENDRHAARAELDDVRSEVSSLLEQARTQSEFIKQEADEIIRTKVRANFEQAQARLDVLRNTEVASRERIVRAQTELTSALSRLDAEPAPALDPAASSAVIEEAQRRQAELGGSTPWDNPSEESTGRAGDTIEGEILDSDVEAEVAESDWGGQEAFEADVAEANEQIESEGADRSPLSAFFGPGPEASAAEAAEDVAAPDTGGQAPTFADQQAAFINTEYVETEYVETSVLDEADGATDHDATDHDATDHDATDHGSAEVNDDLFDDDSFGVTEHVVVESTVDDLPVRGEVTDASDTEDAGFGPATLGEALPSDVPDLGGRAEEDALARLVREAMQEAVDSARKND